MNAHRLNHHDIQAVKAFEDRAKRKARNKQLGQRLALIGWGVVALLALGIVGGITR
jgi:hypothetical protein